MGTPMGIDRMHHGIRLPRPHECGSDTNLPISKGVALERNAASTFKHHASQSLMIAHGPLDRISRTCDSLFNQCMLDLGEERQ